MPNDVSLDYEPGVLRVLQTKSETKAFYNKIAKVLAECKWVLRRGGRIVVVAVSKEGKQGLVVRAFEWVREMVVIP